MSHQLAARLIEADPTEDAWTFSVRLLSKDIEVSNYYDGDAYQEARAELDVVWQADFEVRYWGIKEIQPIIKKITGQVMLLHPDTDEVVERIPISWPAGPTPQHLQTVMGRVPKPEASAKDWADYYGPAQQEWSVETEHEFKQAGAHSISLSVRGAEINVRDRHIEIQF